MHLFSAGAGGLILANMKSFASWRVLNVSTLPVKLILKRQGYTIPYHWTRSLFLREL